jgi:hypothetical protein
MYTCNRCQQALTKYPSGHIETYLCCNKKCLSTSLTIDALSQSIIEYDLPFKYTPPNINHLFFNNPDDLYCYLSGDAFSTSIYAEAKRIMCTDPISLPLIDYNTTAYQYLLKLLKLKAFI